METEKRAGGGKDIMGNERMRGREKEGVCL